MDYEMRWTRDSAAETSYRLARRSSHGAEPVASLQLYLNQANGRPDLAVAGARRDFHGKALFETMVEGATVFLEWWRTVSC
jgi:hypothetical protein